MSCAAGVLACYMGVASWYGPGFHGRATANGERFDQEALTAASLTIPLGSWARVVNEDNGMTVIVKINDRGPYVQGRIMDLSKGAAEILEFADRGLTRVRIEVLSRGDNRYHGE